MMKWMRPRLLVLAVVLATGILVGAVVPLGVLASPTSAGDEAVAPAQRGGTSLCESGTVRVVTPNDVRLCDTTDVTVVVRPACPGTPVHVVFIIDEDYKPGYSNPKDRTAALRSAVARLELRDHPNTRVGVVWMQNGAARKKLDLTNNESKIISSLDVPEIAYWSTKTQCFDCGFREAQKVLDKGREEFPKGADIFEVDVLAPLGVYSGEAVPGLISGSARAKGKDVMVITTCFAWTHCDPALRQAASDGRLYLGYDARNRLPGVLQNVVRESISAFLREIIMQDAFPDGVAVLPESVLPQPDKLDPDKRTLRWRFTEPLANVYTFTYKVQPLALGLVHFGENGWVAMRDSRSRWVTSTMATRALTVSAECPVDTPTPEPTPTNTPTDTPAPTNTPLPTRTPLPTATAIPPTATPRPLVPVYLPILMKEQCRDTRKHVDVALVLDVSTSMRDRTPDGQTKLTAALDGARQFLASMDLSPDATGASDRVAVVGFNRQAWVAEPLGRDAVKLQAALDGLPAGMQEFTRLDLAFERGNEALAVPRSPDTTAVLVLLTDGLPNRVPAAADGRPETTVLAAAQAAKDDGVLVYTIGVGRADGPTPEINPELLRAAASRADMFYPAREAGQLGTVYSQLTSVVPCGGTTFWTGRP